MPGQGAPVTIYGLQGQALNNAVGPLADNDQGPGSPVRLGSRGEQIAMNLWNGMQALAMEGSYWTASTATPGTGITLSVATGTTFSDTQGLICINNTDSSTGTNRSIYLDFITLICTTAPTGTTAHFVAHRIDAQTRGTNGTQLGATGTAPKPINSGFGGNSVGQAFALGASAVSVAATANVRNVGRNVLRAASTPSYIVGDHVTIKFGSAEMAAGGVNIGATTASGLTLYAPPVVIAPGHSYVMNEWATARSAALSGEIVMGWIER